MNIQEVVDSLKEDDDDEIASWLTIPLVPIVATLSFLRGELVMGFVLVVFFGILYILADKQLMKEKRTRTEHEAREKLQENTTWMCGVGGALLASCVYIFRDAPVSALFIGVLGVFLYIYGMSLNRELFKTRCRCHS
jgi:hypothetical protein